MLIDSSIDNNFGYSGYLYNPTRKLYCLRMRWYSTDLGRFIERDPLGYVDGMNTYQYVNGGPLGALDPFGLCDSGGGGSIGGGGGPNFRPTTGGGNLAPQRAGKSRREMWQDLWERGLANGEIECFGAICRVSGPLARLLFPDSFRWQARVTPIEMEEAGWSWKRFWKEFGKSAHDNWREASAAFWDVILFGAVPEDWAADRQFDPDDPNLKYAEAAGAQFGIVIGIYAGYKWGGEIRLGRGKHAPRIAPFGNRTGHKTGRFPHYHRRIKGKDGKTIPGGSIDRHRPWDPPASGLPWWRRF